MDTNQKDPKMVRAGKKAWETRRRNAALGLKGQSGGKPKDPKMVRAGKKAAKTRRLNAKRSKATIEASINNLTSMVMVADRIGDDTLAHSIRKQAENLVTSNFKNLTLENLVTLADISSQVGSQNLNELISKRVKDLIVA